MDIYSVLRTKPHSERHLACYVAFIKSRINNLGPLEKHHICPKADDLFPEFKNLIQHSWNGIELTPREHYIAHLLLWKTYGGSQAYAIRFMTPTKKKTSRLYESLRFQTIKSTTGKKRSPEACNRISEALTGKPKSASAIAKRSAKNLGSKRSTETRKRISEARKGMIFTAEHRENLSKAHRTT